MPKSHVIVRGIAKIEPPTDRPHIELLRSSITPVNVTFVDGQTAQLDPGDPRFALHAKILTELRRVGLPVYAEVESDSRKITTLLIPLQGRVVAILRDPAGDFAFELDNSAKSFALRSGHRKCRQYVKVLQKAQLDGVPVLVTESAAGYEIVDIRRVENPREPALLANAAMAPALRAAAVSPVTLEQVGKMFALVASYSCGILDPTDPCIPFLYPDNGCHARAQEMCSRIQASGILEADQQPAKVWNYSRDRAHPLVVKTSNVPMCELRWRFHVAVALEVQATGEQGTQMLVLDPALFPGGPVPVATWQDEQHAPDSCLVYTSPDPYLPPAPFGVETDPGNKKTDQELTRYRLLLEQRVAEAGPPPYECPGNKAR